MSSLGDFLTVDANLIGTVGFGDRCSSIHKLDDVVAVSGRNDLLVVFIHGNDGKGGAIRGDVQVEFILWATVKFPPKDKGGSNNDDDDERVRLPSLAPF